ncbi:MAG: hypothetical protein IT434_07315, partial [Phycisphaerales bacterium]|nr:hypothetical protein [Phycisphaerales bacterium]
MSVVSYPPDSRAHASAATTSMNTGRAGRLPRNASRRRISLRHHANVPTAIPARAAVSRTVSPSRSPPDTIL